MYTDNMTFTVISNLLPSAYAGEVIQVFPIRALPNSAGWMTFSLKRYVGLYLALIYSSVLVLT